MRLIPKLACFALAALATGTGVAEAGSTGITMLTGCIWHDSRIIEYFPSDGACAAPVGATVGTACFCVTGVGHEHGVVGYVHPFQSLMLRRRR